MQWLQIHPMAYMGFGNLMSQRERNAAVGEVKVWLDDHVSGFGASVIWSILHMGAWLARMPIEVMLIAHLQV